MHRFLIIFACLAPSLASAQDATAMATMNKVLSQKVLTEMNATLSCQAERETDRQKTTALEQRVKELEAKYEPKVPPDQK
jgi:hypothetical protein